MEAANAAGTGFRFQDAVARVREQIATCGMIDLEDYKLVFGDPMQSISFRDLHDQIAHRAAVASQFLQINGIDLAVSLHNSDESAPSCP